MAIKHAVLGLLLERRGYGYELMQRLEGRLGPAWKLNPSTVYAALDQLEDEGMIVGCTREREERGERPQPVRYVLAFKGRARRRSSPRGRGGHRAGRRRRSPGR